MFHSFSSPRPSRHSGFTLIELMVVIAIISLLTAILFPAFSSARESARKSSCMSNLRQIGMAMSQYTQDYDERLPNNDNSGTGGWKSWMDMLDPYVRGNQVWVCPSVPANQIENRYLDPTRGPATYALNNVYLSDATDSIFEKPAKPLAAIQDSVNTIFVGDSARFGATSIHNHQVMQGNYNATNPPSYGDLSQCVFTFRHRGGANFVFFDGHVKWLSMWQTAERNPAGTKLRYFTPTLD